MQPRIVRKVVLPDPDGPSRATISPRRSASEAPLRTVDRFRPLAEHLGHASRFQNFHGFTLRELEDARPRAHSAVPASRRSEHSLAYRPSPRKTSAGSSEATLRNEIAEAPRQRASVPAKTEMAKVGVRISFRSSDGHDRAQAVGHAAPSAKPTTAAIAACLPMIP